MKSILSLFSAKVAIGAVSTTFLVGIVAPSASYAATLTSVDLELWLGVDVSGSINNSEFNLQKTGYVNAFKNPNIHNLISKAPNGVAVGYGYWASSNQQNVAVGWTLLKNATDANSFADAIAATLRPFSGATGVGAAINFGIAQIQNNEFDGTQKIIDISGDGVSNSGVAPATARNAAAAAGITVNGLPIGNQRLINFFDANVRTSDGFVISAATFDDFDAAIQKKLTREIDGAVPDPQPIPTPALLPGLIGLGATALRKRRQNDVSDEF